MPRKSTPGSPVNPRRDTWLKNALKNADPGSEVIVLENPGIRAGLDQYLHLLWPAVKLHLESTGYAFTPLDGVLKIEGRSGFVLTRAMPWMLHGEYPVFHRIIERIKKSINANVAMNDFAAPHCTGVSISGRNVSNKWPPAFPEFYFFLLFGLYIASRQHYKLEILDHFASTRYGETPAAPTIISQTIIFRHGKKTVTQTSAIYLHTK